MRRGRFFLKDSCDRVRMEMSEHSTVTPPQRSIRGGEFPEARGLASGAAGASGHADGAVRNRVVVGIRGSRRPARPMALAKSLTARQRFEGRGLWRRTVRDCRRMGYRPDLR